MHKQVHSGVGDNISAQYYYAEIVKHPTILADVVNTLTGVLYSNADSPSEPPKSFQIQNKIDYNNVTEYAQIFNNHKIFQGKLDRIYDELEIQGGGKKTAFLSNLNTHYVVLRERLIKNNKTISPIEVVRQHADEIILDIENNLLKTIDKSSNISVDLEFIRISIRIVLVDAFMRCKILEEPQ